MRRIIERVVTVVTTTTWTIYWKDDPSPSTPGSDSVMKNETQPLLADDAQKFSETEETSLAKEVGVLEEEAAIIPSSDKTQEFHK